MGGSLSWVVAIDVSYNPSNPRRPQKAAEMAFGGSLTQTEWATKSTPERIHTPAVYDPK